jgi:DNA-binding transcriptional LysR family regulator
VCLFERTTRRMALTEAGTLYLEGARQALMHLQLVTEEVEQLQHELRGTCASPRRHRSGRRFSIRCVAASCVNTRRCAWR